VDERARGLALCVAAYVVWGSLTIYWKALEGLNPFELIGARIVSSFVLLSIVLSATHRWRGLAPLRGDRALLGRVALAAVLLTGNWTAYVYAVVHDNVMETALGYFIAPLGSVLLGVVVLGEKVRPAQRVAVGLAALAVIELTVAYGRVPLIAVIIAVSWSFYGLLKRQVPLGPFESLTGETALLLVPAVGALLVPAAAGHGLAAQATSPQLVLLVLSGVATTVPLLLFAAAAKRVELVTLGTMQYIVPSINFLLGVFLYHEELDASRLVGFALVWAGLLIYTVDSIRQPRQLAPTLEPVGA
jgi:chloramphenicol-sensitive protein RarD